MSFEHRVSWWGTRFRQEFFFEFQALHLLWSSEGDLRSIVERAKQSMHQKSILRLVKILALQIPNCPIPTPSKIAKIVGSELSLWVQDHCMRNKEHIAATNHLCQFCQINDPARQGIPWSEIICFFFRWVGMGIIGRDIFAIFRWLRAKGKDFLHFYKLIFRN